MVIVTTTDNFCCHYDHCDPPQTPLVFIEWRTPVTLTQLSPSTCTAHPSPSARPLRRGQDGHTHVKSPSIQQTERGCHYVTSTDLLCVCGSPTSCCLLQFVTYYNTVYSEHILMYNTSVWKCTRCKSMHWDDSDVAWRDLMNGWLRQGARLEAHLSYVGTVWSPPSVPDDSVLLWSILL